MSYIKRKPLIKCFFTLIAYFAWLGISAQKIDLNPIVKTWLYPGVSYSSVDTLYIIKSDEASVFFVDTNQAQAGFYIKYINLHDYNKYIEKILRKQEKVRILYASVKSLCGNTLTIYLKLESATRRYFRHNMYSKEETEFELINDNCRFKLQAHPYPKNADIPNH